METPKRKSALTALTGTPQVGKSPSTLTENTLNDSPMKLDFQNSYKVRLVETCHDWYDLCHQAGINSWETDEHGTVFVTDVKIMCDLDLESGDTAQLALKPDSLTPTKWRRIQLYAINLVKDLSGQKCDGTNILMSPLLWFNLCQSQGYKPCKEQVLLERVPISDMPRMSLTDWADDITIKLLSTFAYPSTLKLTEALTKYFSKPRRVCLNDVIVIPRDCMDAGEFTMNLWAEAPVVYYKVTKLIGPGGSVTDESTYKVDVHHSNLTQGAGCVTQRVPIRMEWFLSHQPPGPFWRRQPLPGFDIVHNQLMDAITPYLQPMTTRLPATILLTGPPGCGKYSLVRSLAVQLGLHMIKVNCHDLCGDSAAATEARIRNLVTKAQLCTPSILLIENFEALGREKDFATYDVRIAATFGETIRKSRDKSEMPLILIATSSSTKINTDMSEVFLHEFQIPSPNEEQRREILQGLLQDSKNSGDVISLAKRTAGLVLADLVTLVATSRLGAHRRIVVDNYGEHVCPGWLEERGLCESDVTMTMADLNNALHNLQTQHADALGAPKIPDVSWDDVGGLDEVKAEILDTVQLPLQHPELFASDLRRSGVLLYGPPGCGKTLLAKAVAAECSLNFLSVKGPELINMYVGQSEENIREVFSRARSAAPCVVFFDELDSLAPNRGRTGDSGGVMDRVVSQLLAELDGLHTRTDVFIIGATNRPDLLDPALTRPGRFDKLLYVGVPEDRSLQLNVLRALTRKFELCDDVDLEKVADLCPTNLTGADLYALCADAMMGSIRRQVMAKEQGSDASSKVTMEDFTAALETLKPSVSEDEMARYQAIQTHHKYR